MDRQHHSSAFIAENIFFANYRRTLDRDKSIHSNHTAAEKNTEGVDSPYGERGSKPSPSSVYGKNQIVYEQPRDAKSVDILDGVLCASGERRRFCGEENRWTHDGSMDTTGDVDDTNHLDKTQNVASDWATDANHSDAGAIYESGDATHFITDTIRTGNGGRHCGLPGKAKVSFAHATEERREDLGGDGDAVGRYTADNFAHDHGCVGKLPFRLLRSITEGSVGRQWGLSLGDGSGNLFSGGEDFGNHGVSSSASEWPWYVPTVKKVSCGEMSRFLTGEEVVAAEQWLNTPETFHRLLRGIPTNRRARFKMVWPHERLRLLIDAGILEKAGDEKTFSWVKIFAVPEAEKKRCRLIIEPRSINEAYKRNDVSLPLVLPTLHDVENIVSQSSTITSIDFRSFFYQILLGGSVRQFFRAYINNEVYNVCVLPQGACFSPFIAQMFAKAVTRHMFPRKHFIVYIDNIYVSNSYEDPACPCIFDIGSEKRGPEGTILGLRFVTRRP